MHRARQQQHRQTQLLPPSLPAICLPLARPEERAVVKGARDGTVGITPRFHLNLLLSGLSVCLSVLVCLFISLQQYYPSLLSIIASIPSDVLSSTASPPHILVTEGVSRVLSCCCFCCRHFELTAANHSIAISALSSFPRRYSRVIPLLHTTTSSVVDDFNHDLPQR